MVKRGRWYESGVRRPDGRRPYAAQCGIRTKWPSGRRTPLFFANKIILSFKLKSALNFTLNFIMVGFKLSSLIPFWLKTNSYFHFFSELSFKPTTIFVILIISAKMAVICSWFVMMKSTTENGGNVKILFIMILYVWALIQI